MTETQSKETDLNTDSLVLWFDDLGSGNEEYRFLSNFYEGEPVVLPGVEWAMGKEVEFKTGEHAFAAMKFWRTDVQHFTSIVAADGPNSAKALGRSRAHPLREDWEIVKLDVMAAVTRAKYTLDRAEGQMLLDTGDKMLVEGTFWHDDVWGVCLNVPGIPGRNWLGTLLMARRAELRAMKMFGEDTYVQHFGSMVGMHNSHFGSPLDSE